MKKIALLIAIGLLAGTSQAQLSISWNDQSGMTLNDGTTGIVDGGNTALAQLIFSASGTVDIPDASANPTGDNTILDSGTFTEASTGNEFGATWAFQYDNPTFQAGSVFVRVFESTTPGPGTYFFDGPTFTTQDGPVPPQVVNLGPLSGGTGDFGTWQLDQQVIPEPSVMAMLGLGGMFLMIRRRFVKA